MSLTPLSPKIPSPSVSQYSPSHEKVVAPLNIPLIEQAPLIFRLLGQQLEENAPFQSTTRELDPSRIKNFQESNDALHLIFLKMKDLMLAKQEDESSSPSQKILVLEGKVKELEVRFDQMKNEGKLSSKEADSLQKTTGKFHELLSSMDDWFGFQERYFLVDEQLSDSLEAMQLPIFSDLHGWSPAAFKGMAASIDQMTTLIEMSVPALKQRGDFTPELLGQLKNSIHATAWNFNDWFNEIFSHCGEVVAVAEQQWNLAKQQFEAEGGPSLEAYSKMKLAGEQLLSMKQELEQMERTLPLMPDFRSMASNLKEEMKENQLGIEEYAIKKTIMRDFSALGEIVDEAKAQIPERLERLKGVIREQKIHTMLAVAEKQMGKVDKAQIAAYFNQIRDDYAAGEPTLDRYVDARRQLAGFLSDSDVVKFCKEKEAFFNREEENNLDFNELATARMVQLGQPKPGVFSRIFSAIAPDPANWSDLTKYWVRVGVDAIQLLDQLVKIAPSSQIPFPKATPALTQEQQQMIDKETAFLGTILDLNKIDYLRKNPKQIDHFIKRVPEIKPVLEALIKHPTNLSGDEIMSGYRVYRQEVLLTGTGTENLDWITHASASPVTLLRQPTGLITDSKSSQDLSTTSAKTEDAALPIIEGSGPILECFAKTEPAVPLPAVKQEMTHQLKEAVQTVNRLDHQLQQCSRNEFLMPKLPITPQALVALKEETALLRRSLSETMIKRPVEQSVPEWVEWSQSVQKQCYDLNQLESRVAIAMSAYEEAVAMSGAYNSYSSLKELGNKHKNIIKQIDISTAIGIPGLEIPMPQGIASFTVLKFLQANAPDIFGHWDKIRELYAGSQDKKPILENEEVISHLNAIDEGIEKAFLKASEDEAAFNALGFSKETREWLAGLMKSDTYLMVRSTGAEDSKASANAGGNASISYVKPAQKELSIALGEVVRSYFGTGSLQKRLNADLNPFEDELRVAVTTQELIGEEIGGATDPNKIPISLVLFSSEPLYIGDEKFRAMRISATYGHGEGVVGNKGIAADTALLLVSVSDPSKLYVLYDNQEKPERLAPVRDPKTGKITLEKIANSEEMAKRPVLNDELITRLYEWGVIGEKYFDDYTDMEIVIKDGTIYPVQARPINRPPLSASYIDLKKIAELASSPIEKTLATEMIVSAKASVVEIAKKEEILIAETLEKAEALFNKERHKLVVVGQPEPANSHPVVNFSALGMPCLFAENLQEVQDLLEEVNPSHRLAVCVQSAKISLWDTSKGDLKDYTKEGFVVHPAKIAISLPVTGSIPKRAGVISEAPKEIKNLLFELQTATTIEAALQHFNALKGEKWITSLQTKIDVLKEKVAKQPLFGKTTNPVIEAAEALQSKIHEAFTQIETILKHPKKSGRLQFLIHVKDLETLLFQKPRSAGALAQYSVLSMEESFIAADALMLYQSQLPHQAHFADLLMDGSQSPIDAVFDDWNAFLLKLEPIAERTLNGEATGLTSDEILRFKTALHTMRKADVLPIFMTFFVGQVDKSDPVKALREMSALMPPHEAPLIEQVFAQKKEIQQLRNDIGQMGNPKAYPELFARLQKAVDNFLPSNQQWLQKEQWQGASPITRSIAIQTMNELVDLYDTAIKTMKASPEIKSDVEKTQKFKEMLGPYFKLLKGWSQGIVGADGYRTVNGWPLVVYLQQIDSILRGLSETNPNQLRPSREFSVSAAVLGSGAAFGRHLPQTLEDVFTLIHQNLLASTASLTSKLISADQIEKSLLPANLKMALENSGKMGGGNIGIPQQIGLDIDKTGITFYYNVPLRNHSGRFSIRYDRQSGKLTMEAQFLGEARERWDEGAERVAILNAAGMIPLQSKPKVTLQELTFNWDITKEENLARAFGEYRALAQLSLFIIPREMDITDFIDKIVNEGSLANGALLFSGEKPKSVYGRFIIHTYIEKIFQTPEDPILTTDRFLKMVLNSSHVVLRDLLNALLNQIKGEDIEGFMNEIPISYQPFIKQQLELSKSDSKVISLLLSFDVTDPQIQSHILALWTELLNQRKGIPEAIAIALDGFKGYFYVRRFASNLLDKIFAMNEGISEAIAAAQEWLKDSDSTVRYFALQLFSKLVEFKHGIPEAIAAAQKSISDSEISDSALQLLSKLVEFKHGIPEAIAAAHEGMKDSRSNVRSSALNLWRNIVALNEGIPEAIAAAQEGMKDSEYNVRSSALNLWRNIVALNEGIPEAIAAAQEGMKDSESNVRSSALNLWRNIVALNEGIPEAIAAAQEGMKDSESNVRSSALNLWRNIVALNEGIPEVIAAAQEGIQDSMFNVRYNAINLWERIVSLPEGKLAAQQFVNEGWKNVVPASEEYLEALDQLRELLEDSSKL